MTANLLKWWETIVISFAKFSAYRLNFALTILAPSCVFFFVKYNFWTTVYEGYPGGVINGYDLQEMMSYHVWVLIVALLGKGTYGHRFSHGDKARKDIELSHLSLQFLGVPHRRLPRLRGNPGGDSPDYPGHLGGVPDRRFPSLALLCAGFTYCILVSMFWFSLQFLTGILAFWLEETWVLRVLLQLIASFLSGAILPLEFFPVWLVGAVGVYPVSLYGLLSSADIPRRRSPLDKSYPGALLLVVPLHHSQLPSLAQRSAQLYGGGNVA